MTVSLRDSDGTVRLSGDLLASGGATGDVLTQQADGTYTPAASSGGSPVSCLLARDAPFDIRLDTLDSNVLWDALYDNFWDQNPLLAIPAGLGLAFVFDGTSSLIVPSEAGFWALSYFATRAADSLWAGSFQVGGLGLNGAWVQEIVNDVAQGTSYMNLSVTAPMPAGTQVSHAVAPTSEASADPYTCTQVFLSIVRLG